MNDVTNLHGPDDPETEARLARALQHRAEAITPGSRLSEIRAEGRRGRTGKVVALVAAAMVAAVIGGLMVGTLIQRGGQRTASETAQNTEPGGTASTAAAPVPTAPSTSPSSTGSPSTSASTGTTNGGATVPVYWMGPDDKLFREFVAPQSSSDSRGVAAVETMLAGKPLDPDYQRGPWQQATGVEVTQSGEDLTVNLPAGAFSDDEVSQQAADLALQQLVYTATAAVQAQGSVTVLIDGKSGTAWGQVEVGTPMKRDVAARAPVWVTTPQQDETRKAGSVKIEGTATAFEGNVVWKVTREDGTVVHEGHTMAGANGKFDSYAFSVDLAPGTYVVTVTAPDMSGQTEGSSDSKTFTVE